MSATKLIPEHFTMRPLDIEQDAAKLATMWNASDNEWPGSWTRGVPYTAEIAREWQGRQQALETIVWDTGDAIAGYCAYWAKPDEPSATYIALLNVAPQFQGLGLARHMLLYFVERSRQRGDLRLDLGTWSGNLKAVPLYKRCGFVWKVNTSVRMLNFMPAILNLPSAQGFFSRHDWYTTLRRPLTQAEDDEHWEGMGVYTYRFEAPDESLVVRIDREALRIAALETPAFRAAAIVAEHEPPRGLPTPIRWRIENHGVQPLPVSLIASGSDVANIELRRTFSVAPGETSELTALAEVAAEIKPEALEKPAPAIRSLLVLGNELLELCNGFDPHRAVSVYTAPSRISLVPGVEQSYELILRSYLTEAVRAEVRVAPAKGLVTNWLSSEVDLPAGERVGLKIGLTAERAGVYGLPVTVSFRIATEGLRSGGSGSRGGSFVQATEVTEGLHPGGSGTIGVSSVDGTGANTPDSVFSVAQKIVRLPATNLLAFALAPGGYLGAQDDDGDLRLENETMRVEFFRKGAGLNLYDRLTGNWLAYHEGYAVPPQRPSEFGSGKWDLHLERDGEGLLAVARFVAKERQGLVLTKWLRFGAGSLLTIGYEFENQGPMSYDLQLYQALNTPDEESYTVLPLRTGIVRDVSSDVPDITQGEFNQPENFAETWAAVEYPDTTLGAIWGDDLSEVKWSILTSKSYQVAPGQRISPRPLHLYIGPGDWRTVRRFWQRLAGLPLLREQHEPMAQRQFIARAPGGAALLIGGQGTLTVQLERLLQRPLSGTARLVLPEGWSAAQTEFSFQGLDWQQPQRLELQLSGPSHPTAASAQVYLNTTDRDEIGAITLLSLGNGGPVTLHERVQADQQVLTINNGRLELDVTPQFNGTISAFRVAGINHLATPFPEPGTIGWMNPWYGGITPVLMDPDIEDFPGKLYQEQFSTEQIEVVAKGLRWQGVRQRATLNSKGLRGLQLELECTTLGDSPLARLALRINNPSRATRRIKTAGWMVYAAPGGSNTPTIWGEHDKQLKHGDRARWMNMGRWVAASDPASDTTLALVTARPVLGVAGYGLAGNALRLFSRMEVPAEGSTELVAYLVLAASLAEARLWEAMA
jgi:GNAT superfamily N-acetyltransferase